MRDKRLVALHRGGSMLPDTHRLLNRWARECVQHILPLSGHQTDSRILYALQISEEWENGNATVGTARKASLGAIKAAREAQTAISEAVARAAGHAAATAHMADHCIEAAEYALKAVYISGGSVESEREWQDSLLSEALLEPILSIRKEKHQNLIRYNNSRDRT